jgi:hypothetical protein
VLVPLVLVLVAWETQTVGERTSRRVRVDSGPLRQFFVCSAVRLENALAFRHNACGIDNCSDDKVTSLQCEFGD